MIEEPRMILLTSRTLDYLQSLASLGYFMPVFWGPSLPRLSLDAEFPHISLEKSCLSGKLWIYERKFKVAFTDACML